MGDTIWIEVHGRPLEETADDSSTMHRLMDHLDALATKLGVQKLSDFYDYTDLEEAYGDLGDEDAIDDVEDDDADDPPEPTVEERQAKGEWFDSAKGLASISRLRQHLVDRFDDLGFKTDRSTAHWPAQLMDELGHTERILLEAAAGGQPFRLLIVS